jgi:hypothetical protein
MPPRRYRRIAPLLCAAPAASVPASWTFSRLTCDNLTIFTPTLGEGWDGYSWIVSHTNETLGVQHGWIAQSQMRGQTKIDVTFTPPPGSKSGPVVKLRGIDLCGIQQLVSMGANRFVGLQPKVTSGSAPATAADEAPCDEVAAFQSRCSERARLFREHLDTTEFKRGLVFEVLGESAWGLGNVLSLAYLVHSWCLSARRFCYLQIFDAELGRLFGYHDGRSWHPDPEVLRRYPASGNSSSRLRAPHRDKRAWSLSSIHGHIFSPENQNVPLLHVRVPELARDWFISEYFLQSLDRCDNHFVTAPRFPRVLLTPTPTQAFHFRTFHADVRDDRIKVEPANASETAKWVRAAGCDVKRLGALSERGLVLSDSSGWAEWFHSNLGLQHIPPPAGQNSSRSWRAELPTKTAAAVDIYAAGLVRELFVGQTSRYPGPALARSLCTRTVRSLDEVCPTFEGVFPRNFHVLLDPNYLRAEIQKHGNVSEYWQRKAHLQFKHAQAHLPDTHPCKTLGWDMCARSYYQALRGARAR